MRSQISVRSCDCFRVIVLLLAVAVLPLGSCARSMKAEGDARSTLAQLDFRQVVYEAKNKVFPAVVFIKCIREDLEPGKKTSMEVSGSGVIISPEGELLTNWHVVDKASSIRCLLHTGHAMEAELMGSDKDTDLALLRLKRSAEASPLPYAVLGDSTNLTEGDFVMAMGAPWGLSRSVSIGIVACTRRFLPEAGEYSLWLQTDASICPGNSGGPLINTHGEVVGITTLGTFFGGDMGFAVPSETVQEIVRQIRAHGKVDWSWTGLQLQALKDFNRNIYFDENDGVIVAGTDPDSPARRAGFLPRDRIIRISNESVDGITEEDLPAIRRRLGLLPKNEEAKFDIVRGGEVMTLSVVPREKGRVEGEELECKRWDLTVKCINQFNNPDLYFQRKEGVFIYGTKYPGNAASAGLRQNDVIVAINGKDVNTLDDIRAVYQESLENIQASSRLVFTILRNGLTRRIVLEFGREYDKE